MKQLKAVASTALERERLAKAVESAPSAEPNCLECGDLGWVEKGTGLGWCKCRKQIILERKLSIVPPLYRDVDLWSTMEPRPDIHRSQQEVFSVIKENPFDSYLLLGAGGVGKTRIMWALFRNAVMEGREVFACTAIQLLAEYRASFDDPESPVTVRGEWLRMNSKPTSVFIDDIDKARPSEYAAEQLYDVVDAAYSTSHQLVVTSNLDIPVLIKHFERADERYGSPIVRRLADSTVVKMF
jgi:DNA replication protein DnaC